MARFTLFDVAYNLSADWITIEIRFETYEAIQNVPLPVFHIINVYVFVHQPYTTSNMLKYISNSCERVKAWSVVWQQAFMTCGGRPLTSLDHIFLFRNRLIFANFITTRH